MTSVLMFLKQPNSILSVCLCLMTLSVVNAEILNNERGQGFLSHLQRRARSPVSETMEVAALGRPLYPGMLYDSRKDTFIPGVTLWDKKSLSEDLDSRSKLQTDVTVIMSDTISSKSKLLDVSASLKASFLGGLVEVGGSAKYLSDSKSSNQQSRVTMFYSETSRFEQLTMTHLGKITYPQVFDQKTATHVVTGVLYGAQAFMVFDRKHSDHEDKQVIEGELNVMVKKIPLFSIEGHGGLKMDDSEKEMAEQISCTFYGDLRLEQNPTTYLEAVEIYKKLPSMLKENPQNMVPLKVWLYPLSLLDSKAARLERELSSSQVANIEDIAEDLAEVERLCNDLFKHPLVKVFRDIRDRLQSFQSSIRIYRTQLLKAVGGVLTAIRAGEKDDQAVEEIVNIHNFSPFNVNRLKQWLEDAKSELLVLDSNVKTLEWVKTEDSDGLSKLLLDTTIDAVMSLTFTSLQYEDEYLSSLKGFLRADQFKESSEKRTFNLVSERKWAKDPDTLAKMRKSLTVFQGVAESNKDQQKVRFIFSAVSDLSSPGSTIYLYENGQLINKQFKPIPKPLPPIMTRTGDQEVSVKLQSSDGQPDWFRVEFLPQSRSAENDQWLTRETTHKDYVLTGLQPDKEYMIRYRIMSKLLVSEASQIMPFKNFMAQQWLVGGPDGSDFNARSSDGSSVQRISLHVSKRNPYGPREVLKTITIRFRSGETTQIGKNPGEPVYDVEFGHDDMIKEVELWPSKDEMGLRGLSFHIVRKSGAVQHGTLLDGAGECVTVQSNSGKIYGVRGRIGNELYALGFDFL